MRKPAVLSFLLVCALCLGFESRADAAKIGVVDMDRVFSAYDSIEGISESVRAIALSGIEQRERMREEIGRLESELREKGDGLSSGELERLSNTLRKKISEYRDFDRAQKEREAEPVHGALNYIYGIVESYADANGFDLILEKRVGLFGRTVLFTVRRLDITEEIIKVL